MKEVVNNFVGTSIEAMYEPTNERSRKQMEKHHRHCNNITLEYVLQSKLQ